MSVGPHLQGGATDWDKGMAFLTSASPAKFVGGGQRAAEAKALNPNTHCHLRHHVGEQNPPQFTRLARAMEWNPSDKFKPLADWDDVQLKHEERDWYSARHNSFFDKLNVKTVSKGRGMYAALDTSEDMKAHARAFFESFVDGSFDDFARHIDSVSEYNEYFSNSQAQHERARWIRWATACVEVWRDEYRPRYPWIGLVLAETAVGNDIPWELAALSHKYDWVHLGYHPYVPVYKGVIRPDAWRWYSGRWAWMDADYRARGFTRVTWFFGEFGAVGHTSPPIDGNWPNALDPMGGWKHKDVYNGNIAGFNSMILDWMNRTAQTQAWAEGRVIGATIFTSGGGDMWKWFELSGSDIVEVFKFIGANTPPPGTGKPPDPPPPPPPPNPPEEERGLINGYWGDRNWTDIPGTNKQKPAHWNFSYTKPGEPLPSGRPSPTSGLRKVTTISESVHKFVIPTPPDTRPTLPESEGYGGETEGHTWDNGRDGLVLKNPNTFKTFATGTWHDRIWQRARLGPENANASYKMTAYVNVHWHGYPPGNNPPEAEDIVTTWTCGNEVQVWSSHDLPDRTWRRVELTGLADGDGDLLVGVDIEAYWAHPRTVWLGGFEIERINAPAPEEKCEAREPYNRTVWVIPGSASQEQWDKVAHDAKVFGRSVTGSYDDAGIGCGLTSRTAVLFGIDMADRQMFIDWYNEHYTGTAVEFRPLPLVIPIPQLKFDTPLHSGYPVTQRHGDNYEIYMQRYGIPGHNGIDWGSGMGASVYSAYEGVLLANGYDENGYGLFITVQHEQGIITTYAHLSETGIFAPGDEVEKGSLLGYTGNSGWSSGPHLHFGVTVNGQTVNPESFLGPQE